MDKTEKEEMMDLQTKVWRMERQKQESHDMQTAMVICFGSLLASGLMVRFDPLTTGLLALPIIAVAYITKALFRK